MTREVLALVQAGGSGGRMDVLTRERAKPALPYGGTHRLIDFALTSLVHADLRDVWVSLEYQVASIDQYLSGGRPWDLDAIRGGFRRMVPQSGSGSPTEDAFAYGNGDLLLRMSRDLEAHGASTLVVTSADHVFNADLREVIADHRRSGAVATVLTTEVTKKEAAHNVVVETGSGGRITAVTDKPSRPASGTIATEVFVYELGPMLEHLRALRVELVDEAEGGDSGIGDFAEHLLPRLVAAGEARAVSLPGYWRDLGRPETFLQGHRELLAGMVDVFSHPDRPILTRWPDSTAARIRAGAKVEDSLVSPGCDVAGTVVRSVLGPGVRVEPGAVVEDAVLFSGVAVRRGAHVATAILDDRVEVGPDAVVGHAARSRVARPEEIVLVGLDSRVGGGSEVAAGARLEPGTTT